MINKISLKNVRRFDSLTLNIDSNIVILQGNNAIGKTTILEAISLASITKSHRTNNLKEIIKENQMYSDIRVSYKNKDFRIVLSNVGKMVSINNVEQQKISEYIGEFPTIFFSPSDLDIITSSPTLRRQFLNQEISQISHLYLKNLNQYNKLLQERNILLKSLDVNSDTKLLDVITSQLIEVGKKIIIERESFVKRINEVINKIHNKMNSNEVIEIVYQPSVTIDKIDEVFQSKKLSDIISHQTNYGPQRDELIFLLNDKNASKYASQGQIRNIILSTKLALCEIIYNHTNKYPVLLLDDVLSELDITRQNSLLSMLKEFKNIQTFISTVDISSLNKEILNKYQIIRL